MHIYKPDFFYGTLILEILVSAVCFSFQVSQKQLSLLVLREWIFTHDIYNINGKQKCVLAFNWLNTWLIQLNTYMLNTTSKVSMQFTFAFSIIFLVSNITEKNM